MNFNMGLCSSGWKVFSYNNFPYIDVSNASAAANLLNIVAKREIAHDEQFFLLLLKYKV